MSSIKKHIKNVKRKGLSNADICRLIEKSRKIINEAHDRANEEAFLYMLAIPLNILVHDYWSKSAKKRAPKFIEEVISLYESVQAGVVTNEQLADLLWDMAGIKVNEEWLERVKHGSV